MEQQDLFPWTPVFIGLGVAAYFSLKAEPSLLWLASAVCFTGLACVLLRRQGRPIFLCVLAVFLMMLGFTGAALRTATVASPVLEKELFRTTIDGKLISMDHAPPAQRLLLEVHRLQGVEPDKTPKRVRVTWRGTPYEGMPGDIVRLRAVLSHPPAPVMPGGYDYGRQLYFEQIGAVGYATSKPAPTTLPQRSFATGIEVLRLGIGERIVSVTTQRQPEAVAIAVALVTGKRDAIPETAEAALRDAGLAHLLAISGLHMGLVTGLFFFAVRYLLASIPYVALHYPIKKWAAAAALMAATMYLLVSGAAWSTRRAYIMLAVMLVAVMLDRRGLSLRNVAIAALIILALSPEAILQAGFQMSFAAVTVLIAAYEWYERQKVQRHRMLARQTMWEKAGAYMAGLGTTSLLAGFATGPFGVYHFNRITLYGLAGNLLAMPIVGMLIMPAAMAGLLLMPIKLDAVFWNMMAMGIEWVLGISRMVADWPGAVGHVPTVSKASFYLCIAGGLMLCLLRTPLRLAGAAVIALSMLLAPISPQPDLIIRRDARNMAFRVETDGGSTLVLLDKGRERFAASRWLQAAGQADDLEATLTLRELTEEDAGPVTCGAEGCFVRLYSGGTVAISESRTDLLQACQQADLVIAQYALPTGEKPEDCRADILDTRLSQQTGSISVFFKRNGTAIIQTDREYRGTRPWVSLAVE
jgi:competence protein ComEC